jgi:hypothetical protein
MRARSNGLILAAAVTVAGIWALARGARHSHGPAARAIGCSQGGR